jgi:hypothetical protein
MTEAATALDVLDEFVAEPQAFVGSRKPFARPIWGVSAQFQRPSKVAREPKQKVAPASPEPEGVTIIIDPVPELLEVVDYDSLILAMRKRADALNCSRVTLDRIAGLPDGYVGKLLGTGQVKRLGMNSIGGLLGALGAKLVLIEDPEMMERYRDRRETRDAAHTVSATKGHARPSTSTKRFKKFRGEISGALMTWPLKQRPCGVTVER